MKLSAPSAVQALNGGGHDGRVWMFDFKLLWDQLWMVKPRKSAQHLNLKFFIA